MIGTQSTLKSFLVTTLRKFSRFNLENNYNNDKKRQSLCERSALWYSECVKYLYFKRRKNSTRKVCAPEFGANKYSYSYTGVSVIILWGWSSQSSIVSLSFIKESFGWVWWLHESLIWDWLSAVLWWFTDDESPGGTRLGVWQDVPLGGKYRFKKASLPLVQFKLIITINSATMIFKRQRKILWRLS